MNYLDPFSTFSIWFGRLRGTLQGSYLVCMIAHRKIILMILFQQKGAVILSLSWCVMCLIGVENIDHLFLHCPIVSSLRNILFWGKTELGTLASCVSLFVEKHFWGKKGKCFVELLYFGSFVCSLLQSNIMSQKEVVSLWERVPFLSSLWI